VREDERTRISRELHDDLGQQLTGLKLDMSWLANRLKEGREADPDKVADMRHALDAAVTSVRRISTELRPLVLDDLGFMDALKWHAAELAKRSELKINFHFSDTEMGLPDGVATALFRIVQESLNNIVKHANAHNVWINFERVDNRLYLTIQDDGKGIATEAPSGGLGLISMRERAMAFDGVFSVTSDDGRGVTVRIEIPTEINSSQERWS
jgi:signal transduction histidine kinase